MNGTFYLNGQIICAAYDEDGRMLGLELVSGPEDILVQCDVNEVRRVRVL